MPLLKTVKFWRNPQRRFKMINGLVKDLPYWLNIINNNLQVSNARTTDTQWRHKSKKSEILGRCGRQNMLRPYLKNWGGIWISAVQWRRFSHRVSVVRVRMHWKNVYISTLQSVKIQSVQFKRRRNMTKVTRLDVCNIASVHIVQSIEYVSVYLQNVQRAKHICW
jgi:hypothetical protein